MREAVSMGNAESVAFAEWMAWMGMRWLTHRDLLVGMAWAFMEVHELVAKADGDDASLDEDARHVLKDIAAREREGLDVCWKEIKGDAQRDVDFQRGVAIARRAVHACI